MKLNWIKKQKYISKKDVSLNFCKNKNRAYTSIILRNGLKNTVAPSGYIVVAINGERLYFQRATQELGYKLSNKG